VNGAVYEPATKQGKRTRSLQQSDPDFIFFSLKEMICILETGSPLKVNTLHTPS